MNERQLHERVGAFWERNYAAGKTFTVNHFVSEGCKRRTIYALLAKLEKGQDIIRKSGSGGHNKKLTNAQRASIGRWLKNKKGKKQRSMEFVPQQ
jgi:hypothetical protein